MRRDLLGAGLLRPDAGGLSSATGSWARPRSRRSCCSWRVSAAEPARVPRRRDRRAARLAGAADRRRAARERAPRPRSTASCPSSSTCSSSASRPASASAARCSSSATAWTGPLGDELRLMQQEQSMGLSSDQALTKLLDRCDTPSVRSFVRSLQQGERLGVSIGTILRNLAVEMRTAPPPDRRGARAEGADQDPLPARVPDLPGDVHRAARPGGVHAQGGLRLIRLARGPRECTEAAGAFMNDERSWATWPLSYAGPRARLRAQGARDALWTG